MHAQIVEFRLRNMTPEGYAEMCDQLAPAFGDVPGLLAKVWLADPEENRFGGFYLWEGIRRMRAFGDSELSRAVATHPNLADFTSRELAVLERPTRLTARPLSQPADSDSTHLSTPWSNSRRGGS